MSGGKVYFETCAPCTAFVVFNYASPGTTAFTSSFNEAVTCANNKWTSGGWSSGNPGYNHRVSVSLVGGAAASHLNTNETEAVSTGTLDCANIGFGGAATSDSYTNSVIANDVLQSTAVLKVVGVDADGNSPNIAR